MKKIKILHLSSNEGLYGAENILLELCKGLAGTKYQPTIGVLKNSHCPHIELAEAAHEYRIDTEVFECYRQFDPRTIFNVRKYVTENKITIVHAHGYKSRFYTLLATMYKNINLVANCYPVYSRKGKLYNWLDNTWLSKFDKIVTDSDAMKKKMLDSVRRESKVACIHNGVDIHRFKKMIESSRLRKKFNISQNRTVIAAVGRLSKEKGHIVLLKAAKIIVKKFPHILFMIVGEGPMRHELEKEIEKQRLQGHVLLTGVRDDIPDVLAMIDLFVLPSLGESLPMALLEAMASEKPVIATNVGMIPSIIKHNHTGLIVPPNNINSMKEAILTLLNDKSRALALASRARTVIVQKFSSKRMAQKYIEAYEDLLGVN